MNLSATNKERVTSYYNSIASDYEAHVGRGPLSWLRTRERRAVTRLLDLSSITPSGSSSGIASEKSLLDAGCGQGYYSRLALSQGFRVTAIDASAAMVEEAKTYAHHAEVADLENWNTRERFDRIVCAGVLDFVSDPSRCVKRLTQLLKPGGKMVLLVPRKGFGGLIYRAEKGLQGIQVNLFDREWGLRFAQESRLELTETLYPLPTNLAFQFSFLKASHLRSIT